MSRTTLTVLFAALALSLPAFAQQQDATQAKPLAELKETESTWEEVPVVIGGGATKPATEAPAVGVVDKTSDDNLHLDLWAGGGILNADLFFSGGKCFGAVLIGLTPELVPVDTLGIALLRDAAVLGMGFAPEGYFGLRIPVAKDLKDIKFFGQGVVADGIAIRAGGAVRGILQ